MAEHFTVVAADLRGYGDSSKPPANDHHTNYSKREMARDSVELMKALGFEQFSVLAHDRGARVARARRGDARTRRRVHRHRARAHRELLALSVALLTPSVADRRGEGAGGFPTHRPPDGSKSPRTTVHASDLTSTPDGRRPHVRAPVGGRAPVVSRIMSVTAGS